MHRLLERQIKKHLPSPDGFDEPLRRFIEAVDQAYQQADEDRALLERSMELSSVELFERNKALAAAERKYRAIFENATEGIFQIAPDGRFLSANPAMAQMLGYEDPAALIAGVSDAFAMLEPNEDGRAVVRSQIDSESGLVQYECQARRRDGELIWTSQTAHAVTDKDGKPERYEGTVHDISKRKRVEKEHEELQSRLISLSRQSGMAEVATGILHNVGNVLNSINVSASLATQRLRESKLPGFSKAMQLLGEHRGDLAAFLGGDPKGKQLPEYLARLNEHLMAEQRELIAELEALTLNLEHVKRIVTMQQDYARVTDLRELVCVAEVVEDAIRLQHTAFEEDRVRLVRRFETLPPVNTDKHHIMQIVVNLLGNARDAVRGREERTLTVRVGPSARDPRRFMIEVQDTGVGIPAENLTRIFSHGFTTKSDGHGFGLHSSALAAQNLGGSLSVRSDGPGAGATFTLELPMATEHRDPALQEAA